MIQIELKQLLQNKDRHFPFKNAPMPTHALT